MVHFGRTELFVPIDKNMRPLMRQETSPQNDIGQASQVRREKVIMTSHSFTTRKKHSLSSEGNKLGCPEPDLML